MAQDSTARLGRPVAPVVRGQSPDLNNAAAFDIPKVMPKGKVTDVTAPGKAPGVLPVPGGPMPPTSTPLLPVPPGGTISGPVIVDPGTPMYSTPMPGGPINDPMGLAPTPGSDLSQWYTSAEGLIWYVKSYSVPALVTVGPAFSGANLVTATSILYGRNTIDTNPRYGARLGLGYWLNPCWAVELSGFYTQPETTSFSAASTQYPGSDLARPFASANRLIETSEIIGRPGVALGDVTVKTKSRLFGLELNARNKWWESGENRLDLIAGIRFLSLEEELSVSEYSLGLAGAGNFAGVERGLTDTFKTKNRFYGGQVGAIFEHVEGRWTFGLTAKIAAGISRQTVDINGQITQLAGGGLPDQPGGLLALSTNSGLRRRDTFSIVPEAQLSVGYDLTANLRLTVGYSAMYWSNVARPGPQIDRTLDENVIPDFPAAPAVGGIRPQSRVNSEGIWAQGVNFGLIYKW
jgi:hypothetical protein